MQVRVYEEGALPPAYEWQALSAARMEWPYAFQGGNRSAGRLRCEHEPDHDLTAHAVVSEGEVLVSYASILRTAAASGGERFEVLGLSGVITFPSFRREGAGRRAVAAAEDWMAGETADLGMLFCLPEVESFYRRGGWETAVGPTWIGPRDALRTHPRVRMVRFLSARAEAERQALLSQGVHVGRKAW